MGVNRKRGEGRGNYSGMGGEGKEGDFQKFEILTTSMLYSANLKADISVKNKNEKIGNFKVNYAKYKFIRKE